MKNAVRMAQENLRSEIERNLDGWYGRLDDIVEELESMGLEVLFTCAEWITCASDLYDCEFVIRLGGTPTTITIEGVTIAY